MVPNAVVTAKNTGTNAEATAKTNAEGYYRISNLPPGNYVVSVEAAGFRKMERPPSCSPSPPTCASISVSQIGQVSEVVNVSESGVQVNTEDAQMGRSLIDIPALPNISGAGRAQSAEPDGTATGHRLHVGRSQLRRSGSFR